MQEFGGNCCDDGCLNPGYYHIESLDSEDGYICETECCKPFPKCGNGKVEKGEECDDGNKHIGDGCGKRCQVECGWTCPTANSPCSKERRNLEKESTMP